MIRLALLMAAAAREKTVHVDVRPWLFATLLFVGGVPSVLIGAIGWRRARAIVPTSLPEDLYWKRYRVIRRGAIAFVIVGTACVVLGTYALTVHGYTRTVRTRNR